VLITSRQTRVDIGKLIMVPTARLIFVADLSALRHHGTSDADGVLRSFGATLVLLYAVMIWCYVRRGQALATSDSATAHVAAVAATWLPFALPLLHGAPPGPARQAISDVLLVCGMSWSVWSLRSLDRNVSVLAQARGVVDRGPYRWLRHPLYTGEIVSTLGVAIAMNSLTALAFWLVLCVLQVYRALREEQVLLKALPAYRAYRRRTAALMPGVFWRRPSRWSVLRRSGRSSHRATVGR
jgi:protein-S-isoprenylcysteine O-methyltransferase Ste14